MKLSEITTSSIIKTIAKMKTLKQANQEEGLIVGLKEHVDHPEALDNPFRRT